MKSKWQLAYFVSTLAIRSVHFESHAIARFPIFRFWTPSQNPFSAQSPDNRILPDLHTACLLSMKSWVRNLHLAVAMSTSHAQNGSSNHGIPTLYSIYRNRFVCLYGTLFMLVYNQKFGHVDYIWALWLFCFLKNNVLHEVIYWLAPQTSLWDIRHHISQDQFNVDASRCLRAPFVEQKETYGSKSGWSIVSLLFTRVILLIQREIQ